MSENFRSPEQSAGALGYTNAIEFQNPPRWQNPGGGERVEQHPDRHNNHANSIHRHDTSFRQTLGRKIAETSHAAPRARHETRRDQAGRSRRQEARGPVKTSGAYLCGGWAAGRCAPHRVGSWYNGRVEHRRTGP